MCDLLKIHKTRSAVFRPSGNSQIERYNRTLMDAIRCYLGNPVWITRYREQLKQGVVTPTLDEYCLCRGPYNNRFIDYAVTTVMSGIMELVLGLP